MPSLAGGMVGALSWVAVREPAKLEGGADQEEELLSRSVWIADWADDANAKMTNAAKAGNPFCLIVENIPNRAQ